jgi:hypothetical protein
MRALPVALALMDQARAWKHDKDLSNCLTDQAAGLLGHDAVLTIIGPQNAGKLPDAWAGQLGLTGPRRHYAGIRGARGRVMAWPAAGYGVAAAGGLRGEEDEQA